MDLWSLGTYDKPGKSKALSEPRREIEIVMKQFACHVATKKTLIGFGRRSEVGSGWAQR